ncbi:hypothetical protein [Streptomyces sp. N2A]|uniref:hypothetical protein n=1 Tax=Streptomyces sp. N2A TaxID=3073936 RepID=UPI00286FB86C|nr:hypothetical protein [Streptomyces sp. N2A]
MERNRSLSTLGLQVDLTRDPLDYPGPVPRVSGLLVNDSYLRLMPVANRRLGQWQVDVDEEGLPGDAGARRSCVPLSYALLRHNQAPVGDRYPVLAVGSNASPAQMARKLEQRDLPVVLPMTTAEVHDLDMGVSAHISDPGYVPATPIVAPGKRSQMFVCWLSAAQLKALDDSEPNYQRQLLPGETFPVVLPSGEWLRACYVYVSRWGCLLGKDGEPLRLGSQRPLLAGLLERSAELGALFGRRPETMSKRAGVNEQLRERCRQVFHDEGWVGTQPTLAALCCEESNSYDELLPLVAPSRKTALPRLPAVWSVVRSTANFDRHGQASVRLSRACFTTMNSPELLVMRRVSGYVVTGDAVVLARADVSPDAGGVQPSAAVIQVDQVLRNAVGVEVGEQVVLTPAWLRRCRWLDWLFGEPNYVTCRVQSADLTSVESEVCLLDPLSLDILGLQTGEEVVIEGLPDTNGEVSQVRIKAFRTSDPVQKRREELHGGDFLSRFPSPLDALAVYPDLPWVFLDSSTRARLGLSDRKLCTVRMRTSRRYQFTKELRELLLLIGLAFIGLVALAPDNALRWSLLGLLTVLPAVVVIIRMHGRLGRTVKDGRSWLRLSRRSTEGVAPRGEED